MEVPDPIECPSNAAPDYREAFWASRLQGQKFPAGILLKFTFQNGEEDRSVIFGGVEHVTCDPVNGSLVIGTHLTHTTEIFFRDLHSIALPNHRECGECLNPPHEMRRRRLGHPSVQSALGGRHPSESALELT